jgi:type VI secretion system secreted protein VgrG
MAPEAPDPPKEPVEAADVKPGEKDQPIAAPEQPAPTTYSASTPASSGSSAAPAQAQVLRQAAQDGTPFCEECEKARQAEEAEAMA